MEILPPQTRVQLFDFGPFRDTFREEVLEGLAQTPKSIPSKFFYDARGSQLFDEITGLDEYYPTRTELSIMEARIDEMVDAVGAGCLLVEYGSGSSRKTRILLDHLPRVAGYIPIDISRSHLVQSAQALAEAYDGLRVFPVCADYTKPFMLPDVRPHEAHIVVYFPGSTIGNFTRDEASAFLRRIAALVGPGGGLLIGVDLQKDPAVLEAAYNDARGVTAAFNKNLLVRINRELDGDVDLDAFAHDAVYDEAAGRIEMYLVSLADQTVHVGGQAFAFAEDERILTEYSHKFTPAGFAALADTAGFDVTRVWTDPRHYFSIQYLTARP